MKKFFELYRIPVETLNEWKKNTSPEKMATRAAAVFISYDISHEITHHHGVR